MEEAKGIYVECLCGAKYDIAPENAGEIIDCEAEGCGRELRVPDRLLNERFRPLVRQFDSSGERERGRAVEELAKLGSPVVLPVLMRGARDPAREVVNKSLRALMMVGDFGRDYLLMLMQEGVLKFSRVVAMVRELEWWEGTELICDLVDSGKLNENQISETIELLGESKRRRCISTLTNLRRAFPNLAMMVDNALANYRHLDSQVNKIPEDATRMADGSDARINEMAESKRTQSKKGCLVVIAAIAPAVIWLVC